MGSVDSPSAIARLKADLKAVAEQVQHACTSGYTGIARVTVVGDVGYWYFRRGAIIHALTLDLVGEDAALRMLSWDDGQWESCSRPWPSEQSIFLSWVELFQRAGEQQRAALSRAPSPSAPASQPPPPPPRSHRPAPRVSLAPTPPQPPRRESPPLGAAQLESLAEHTTDFVVVASDGRSRTLRGHSEGFAELASYVSELCEEIGSEFGSGRGHTLEVTYRARTLLIASYGAHTFGLTVPRDADLDLIKSKLRI